ncbi:MAG: hypothetical protein ACR2QH_10605 [Geminicoccaceae bacterium]|jgi:predicted  nucleic acid-binding Zn-ribbon protein
MKIMKIFNRDDWKRSKKIKALHKVLDKLKKKRHKIEDDLKSESSKKKIKKLEIKLKTNKHHRHKAEKLIRELE